MNILAERVFRKLLTELRTITDFRPTDNVYYAMLRRNGYVTYFQLGKNARGGKQMAVMDPNDPFKNRNNILGQYVQKVEKDPKLKADADKLVQLGFLQIKDKKEEFPEITSKYHNDLFPTPADVPAVVQKYSDEGYDSAGNTLKVDHDNKVIDLDANWQELNPRRTDPRKEGGAAYSGASYVIPSGSTAFENNELGLQKMLKFLMSQDSRIKSDYKITGDEKYRMMTVGQLVEKPGEVETALTGRGKLVMFHGTSKARWRIIESKGLRPGASNDVYIDLVTGWSDKNVYLTFSHTNAENYATRQAIKDKSEAVVLRVEVPDVANLVADEDVFGQWSPKRKYDIFIKGRYGEWRPYTVGGKNESYLKNIMEMFGNDGIEMEGDGKELYKDVMQYITNELPKKSLREGVIAYRGFIPPKFIELDMVYERKPFKTGERKGGPDEEEYNRIRQSVQQSARRYDEALVRKFVGTLISGKRSTR
jgi:hypothetical protein